MTYVSNYTIVIIICLQASCQCIFSTIGQYIYEYYLEIYWLSTNTTQNLTKLPVVLSYRIKTAHISTKLCTENTSNNNAQLWAQEQSADLFFRINLWTSIPLIIMTYVLGLYTPKLGRQLVLLLTMFGSTCQLVIWLAIIYFHLSNYWWYIASIIVGLSGSTYTFNFILNLIVTDNTNANNRSIRFVLIEAVGTCVSAVMTFATGYYIRWRGFKDLYWFSLALEIVSIVIVIFFVKNSPSMHDERTPLLSSPTQSTILRDNCRNCFNVLTIFSCRNRSPKKSISLILILLSYIFYLLASSAYASFLWYLLDSPFCWSSENIGNYTALSLVFYAIFSSLGMKFLNYINTNDTMICIFSHACFIGSSIWIAFAKYSWQLYAGLSISPFADYQNSLTIPMMSRFLEVQERNNAFTLVAEINTIIMSFGDSIFNWIYAETVTTYHNFNLLIAAGIGTISLILNICLWFLTRRLSNNVGILTIEPEPTHADRIHQTCK